MPRKKRRNRKGNNKGPAFTKDKKQPPIWEALCQALGAEFRDRKEIKGASGLSHPVEAIGVDDKDKRLIVISSETNPRVAALLRGDIQGTTELRVLVARPLAIDLAHVVRKTFFTQSGSINLHLFSEIGTALKDKERGSDRIQEILSDPMMSMLSSAARSAIPIKAHIFGAIEQLYAFEWKKIAPPDPANVQQLTLDVLTQLSSVDSLKADREQGICPIPTYELTEQDWELFGTGNDVDHIQKRLKEIDVFQYFYPPADNLALGLVDRGISSVKTIEESFSITNEYGHKVSPNTLIPDIQDVKELIEELKGKGYIMDSEFDIELTEDGRSFRSRISVRPSEGLMSKIAKIFSAKIDIGMKI